MKKTLTAIALFGALTAFAETAANAQVKVAAGAVVAPMAKAPVASTLPPHVAKSEGVQNYYYYFGTPCCGPVAKPAAPCAKPVSPCAAPCPKKVCPPNPCAPCPVKAEYEQICTTSTCSN